VNVVYVLCSLCYLLFVEINRYLDIILGITASTTIITVVLSCNIISQHLTNIENTTWVSSNNC